MKIVKRIFKIILTIICVIAVMLGFGVYKMTSALKAQNNADIDMSKVADGRYIGESGEGLVQAEVAVEVKDHKITKVDILKHKNGKGKPAEAVADDMVSKNTYDVDAVTGATVSSKTIINAANKALQSGIK